MMNETAIFILPIVNYDGYLKVLEKYTNDKTFLSFSKNMNAYETQSEKCYNNVGVDLLRNYGV